MVLIPAVWWVARKTSEVAVSVNEKYASAPAPPQVPVCTCGISGAV